MGFTPLLQAPDLAGSESPAPRSANTSVPVVANFCGGNTGNWSPERGAELWGCQMSPIPSSKMTRVGDPD